MAKAVLIQNPQSIYQDEPGVRYHFPKQYLGTLGDCVGDWVLFYQGRKGALGYVSVQRINSIRPDPNRADHYFAELDVGSALQFSPPVPRSDINGLPYETMLRTPEGGALRGGASVLAVRRLSEEDFSKIVEIGLAGGQITEEVEVIQSDGFSEPDQAFLHDAQLAGERSEILTSRKVRDASFARMVKDAYSGRCAMSGLELRNGGGAAEVQAAHIRPVSADGPDTIQNGMALSGTLHWMFDRGLLSLTDECEILIAHNKVDLETVNRLVVPDKKLRLPKNPIHHPHPAYIHYHREHVFGGAA